MNPMSVHRLAIQFLHAAGCAAAALLPAAESSFAADSEKMAYTPERFREIVARFEETADSRFRDMGPQYFMFKGLVDRGEGDLAADALLHVARENVGATNEMAAVRFHFAVTWLDEFGGTNALPFLLEETMRKRTPNSDDRLEGLSITARHMTIASFFRIANRKNATGALREAAGLLSDGKREWLRGELYYESTQTVLLHESSARSAVAERGGGVVNLRSVREPICGFLADCYGGETDSGRLAFLDGFIRERLPEWETSERRMAGAERMLRLHPESKEAAAIVRSVREARAAPAESAERSRASDTEVVEPRSPEPSTSIPWRS